MVATSRTTNCPAGQSCFIWWPSAGDGSLFTLPAGWSVHCPTRIGSTNWHQEYWVRRVDVPIDAQPGSYSLGANQPSVMVVAPRTFCGAVVVPAGDSIDAVQTALNSGYAVRLGSGLHEWNRPLIVPTNSRISAYGALVRSFHTLGYQGTMFATQGGFDIEGGEWHGNYLAHQYPRPTDRTFRFRGCKFVGFSGGEFSGGGAHYDHCEFVDSQCFLDTGDVVSSSRFTGWNQHPVFNFNGGCLVVDCTFENTSRGVIMQNGHIANAMVIGNRFIGVHHGRGNAGECILLEGGTASDNAIITNTFSGCSGHDLSLHVGTGSAGRVYERIQFRESISDTTGVAIDLASFDGHIRDIEIHNPELSGPINLSNWNGSIERIKFQSARFRVCPRSCGNQLGYPQPALYDEKLFRLTNVQASEITFGDCLKIEAGKVPEAVIAA